MTDTLVALLGDRVAGVLERHRGGAITFAYDAAHRADADPTPLSVSMPVAERDHPDAVVAPWLWGLLPDDDAVLAAWGRRFGVSARSPFSLLSSPVGEDCAGAVRFAAPDRVDAVRSDPGAVAWLDEADVAERLRQLDRDRTAWLGASFSGRFSLAGAQSKVALLEQDGRWGEPSGSAATNRILKPGVPGFPDMAVNEHLCLAAARHAGLDAARTRIGRFEDQVVLVVERYDRRTGPDGPVRIHQEDICQALSIHPRLKYQAEGGPGPADVARLLRTTVSRLAAETAVAAFADALIWNWLIAGTDGHGKNHALLLAGGEVRLAPLYDVASALPYGVHERGLRFAMKIRDYRVFPAADPWPAVARELGLDPARLDLRVRDLAGRAPDALADAARGEGVAAVGSDLPGRLVDLVADRCGRCVRVLGVP